MTRPLAAILTTLVVLAAVPAFAQAPPASRFTVTAESLLWWFKGAPAPPLVTDGLADRPGTHVFLGGDDVDTNPNPGFRLTTGYAFTDRWGVDSSVLYIPTRTFSRSVSSSGQPGTTDLLIPFRNAQTGQEDAVFLSKAGSYAGYAREEFSNSLLGADLNGTMRLLTGGGWRVDGLAGFRYLRLRETYRFQTNSPNIPPNQIDIFQTEDRFDATNNFFGGQLGVRGRFDWGAWFASGVAKVGLGAMVQTTDIEGTFVNSDSILVPPVAYPASGWFALAPNFGQRTRTVFAVMPEVGLNVGYRITPWLAVVAGYTFLYASDVVRAPQQINRLINPEAFRVPPTLPPPPVEPAFRFKSSDFWAQGLTLGVAFQF